MVQVKMRKSKGRMTWAISVAILFVIAFFFVLVGSMSLVLNNDDSNNKTIRGHTVSSKFGPASLLANPESFLRTHGFSQDQRFMDSSSSSSSSAAKDLSRTIAYAVSVTGCGSDPLSEGAAVLKHSIHRASIHGTGRYDYDMFAIYHPQAESCARELAKLGYHLLEREVFVAVADIEGEFLRQRIEKNGCCGEKELIKLEAYTLTDYPIFVHLDLDVLVLKPLDELFDWILDGKGDKHSPSIMWPDQEWPHDKVDAFYTVDYNMVRPKTPYKPVQGGFLVARPSQEAYEEFRAVVKKGDFRQNGGWGGKVGPFYGSMTFQGLIPYYYLVLHPGTAVELNRCLYNQMCDNPRTEKTVHDVVHGDCRVGTEECEDCRSRPLEDIYTVHFTLCQKPWWCIPHKDNMIQHRLCRKLTAEWYRVRSELEQAWGRPAQGSGEYDPEHFRGFCNSAGRGGYIRLEQPFGTLDTGAHAQDILATG